MNPLNSDTLDIPPQAFLQDSVDTPQNIPQAFLQGRVIDMPTSFLQDSVINTPTSFYRSSYFESIIENLKTISLRNYVLFFYMLIQIGLFIAIISLLKQKDKIDLKTKKIRNNLFITGIVFILFSFFFSIFILVSNIDLKYIVIPMLLNFIYGIISIFPYYKHLPNSVINCNMALAFLALLYIGLVFWYIVFFVSFCINDYINNVII
jgi:hypothetical protein